MEPSHKTIYRAKRSNDPFVRVLRTVARDKQLSFKARGMMLLFLSCIDEWDVNQGWLCSQVETKAGEGKEAIAKGMKELERNGYALFFDERDEETGRVLRCVWTFHEDPLPEGERSNRTKWRDGSYAPQSNIENPCHGKPCHGKPSHGKPCHGEPPQGNPATKIEQGKEEQEKVEQPKEPPAAQAKKSKPSAGAAWENLPAALNVESFKTAWGEYVDYRRKSAIKPLQRESIERLWRILEKWGLPAALAGIDYSIANGYQGIFRAKEERPDTPRRGAAAATQPNFGNGF